MQKEEVKKWGEVLKEKNVLGIPQISIDILLNEQDEFKAGLQTARFIERLLPNGYEEALNIYQAELTKENVVQAIKCSHHREGMIEEIIWGYMIVSSILSKKTQDIQGALDSINKAKELMEIYPIHMTYISRGQVYYERWKLLEKDKKVEQIIDEINELIEYAH